MSYSLYSLKRGYIGDYMGTTMGVIKGDTRSLDCSSYRLPQYLHKASLGAEEPQLLVLLPQPVILKSEELVL